MPTETAEINATFNYASSDDEQTVHSADTSDDHFIHISERPVNYYRNQIIFRIANLETTIMENVFPGFKRIILVRKQFSKNEICDYLRQFHNGKQTAILAPESLHQSIQETFREHFSYHGHFIMVTKMVEDVINPERQDTLIAREHERAHRGTQEIENQLKRSYFFPKMGPKIRIYVNSCRTCQKHKYDRKPYNIKISPRPIPNRPFDRVHMDIFSINKENFLSLIDSFSKHFQLIPMKTKNLADVKRALTKYISTFGPPRLIVTDHETTFTSTQLREFLDNMHTQIQYASSSESNGQVEKTHSTIIEIYNTNKDKFRNNDTKSIIRASTALYNNSVHSATGFTPNEVIFNQTNHTNPNEIELQANDLYEKTKTNLQKAQRKMMKQNEAKENPPELSENQIVHIKPNIRKKTDPRGNEAIIHQVTSKTFKINNTNVKRNKNKIRRIKK